MAVWYEEYEMNGHFRTPYSPDEKSGTGSSTCTYLFFAHEKVWFLTSRRINVQCDILVGIFICQVQKLGDQDIGDFVIDVGSKQQDAILQQSTDDIQLPRFPINSGKGRRTGRSRSWLRWFTWLWLRMEEKTKTKRQ